jgi:DNA invertase Pin-like site-specific DNA recombinase
MKDELEDGERLRTTTLTMEEIHRAAISYARVSTDEQAIEGKSLETQRERIEEYAKAMGFQPLVLLQDESSAMPDKTHRRLGFQQLKQLASAFPVPIIVTAVDRLTRTPDDVEFFIAKEVPVHVVDIGRRAEAAELRKLAKKAEREGCLKRKKTKDAMVGMQANGSSLGSPEVLQAVRSMGTQSNMERADRQAARVAKHLLQAPGAGRLTHKELADSLNLADV